MLSCYITRISYRYFDSHEFSIIYVYILTFERGFLGFLFALKLLILSQILMHISCLRIVLPLWAHLCMLNLSIDAKVIEHMEHPCRICCLSANLIPSAPPIWREQFRQFQNSDSDSYVRDSVDSPCRNCQSSTL